MKKEEEKVPFCVSLFTFGPTNIIVTNVVA
jgi:hypothetical protein